MPQRPQWRLAAHHQALPSAAAAVGDASHGSSISSSPPAACDLRRRLPLMDGSTPSVGSSSTAARRRLRAGPPDSPPSAAQPSLLSCTGRAEAQRRPRGAPCSPRSSSLTATPSPASSSHSIGMNCSPSPSAAASAFPEFWGASPRGVRLGGTGAEGPWSASPPSRRMARNAAIASGVATRCSTSRLALVSTSLSGVHCAPW
mmetsp:Transcript_31150/g.78707  ORF Transcript_31150/g.78707 Transcript_31150/m.78707 type:complete len:202 (-) Transcript_31150:621-1226(-)